MNFETIKEENETIKTFSFLFYWEEKFLNKKIIKALKLETIRVFLRGKEAYKSYLYSGVTSDRPLNNNNIKIKY